MTTTTAPTRAGYEDELALVGYEHSGEALNIGDEIPVIDPRTGGTWQGVVIDADPTLRCVVVRVDTDTFLPPVSYFEETGPEAQREMYTLDDASNMSDLEFFENKSSGKLYTLREIRRMLDARDIDQFFS